MCVCESACVYRRDITKVWLCQAKSYNFYLHLLLLVSNSSNFFIALHSANNIYRVKMTCELDFNYLIEHHEELSYTSKTVYFCDYSRYNMVNNFASENPNLLLKICIYFWTTLLVPKESLGKFSGKHLVTSKRLLLVRDIFPDTFQ